MDATTATIITTSVTTAGSIIATLITTQRNKTLKKENEQLNSTNEKLNIRIQEVKLISTGMVVGYFFSFIQPLFKNLSSASLMIVQGDKRYPLRPHNTQLELYMPNSLDRDSFADVENFYRAHSGVGAIEDENGHVLYKKINYRIVPESQEAIILVDLPNILNSALEYYKAPMYGNYEDLKELLEKEMSNFKAEIQRMIENARLGKKIVIRQYA